MKWRDLQKKIQKKFRRKTTFFENIFFAELAISSNSELIGGTKNWKTFPFIWQPFFFYGRQHFLIFFGRSRHFIQFQVDWWTKKCLNKFPFIPFFFDGRQHFLELFFVDLTISVR